MLPTSVLGYLSLIRVVRGQLKRSLNSLTKSSNGSRASSKRRLTSPRSATKLAGKTVNNVCNTLNAIMELDVRLAECAVNCLSATFVALRLWTLRTPGPEPTRLIIPPGAKASQLYATLALTDRGSMVLQAAMTADRFADAFIERLDALDAVPLNPLSFHALEKAEHHLTTCFVVLRLLCKKTALVHAALWKRNYIIRWSKTLMTMTPYLHHSTALRLCAQVFQVATECSGNTTNAVLDVIKRCLFLDFLEILSRVPKIEGVALQSASSILFRMNNHCHRIRIAKAVSNVVESHPQLSLRLASQPEASSMSTMFSRMCSSARAYSLCRQALVLLPMTICDNALHQRHGQKVTSFDRPQTCSGCHLVTYCSFECQEEDWRKRHWKECALMKQSHLGRSKTQRHYHHTCRAAQIQVTAQLITGSDRIKELEGTRREHGAHVTVLDTTEDPQKQGIYTLTLNTYLQNRIRSDCAAMDQRVVGMVEQYQANAKGDVWLVDAGFANGCDEMVAVLMKIEKIEGQWKVVESVPRVLPNARYGLFPYSKSVARHAS
ncbi:hypothetical protein BKA70DRAFT_1572888 [Coprinopsis sp. MPI-PUGE-AT-0042]|nr:hypothetical protein BKA70DRAFT_1572888 [Coprinopsis sp. MPI-PUGE-AT-0042]